jgi:hypothetical protein
MSEEKTLETTPSLGRPSLQIAGLQAWIHGRQFPDSNDYWDANWLYCTLHCGSPDSDVWLRRDPFLHIPELQRFYNSLLAFARTMTGVARLETMEENLKLSVEAAAPREIGMDVFISANPSVEEHHYIFSITHELVEILLRQLVDILHQYPVKGQP